MHDAGRRKASGDPPRSLNPQSQSQQHRQPDSARPAVEEFQTHRRRRAPQSIAGGISVSASSPPTGVSARTVIGGAEHPLRA